MFFFKINVTANGSSINIEMYPLDEQEQFLVLVRRSTFPQISGENKGWDYMSTIPLSMTTPGSAAFERFLKVA